MKRLNNAFTLTELLVALGVIAILCAILLPIVFNMMPNQNIIMAKRAYYTTQTIVSDLLNDEACYPDRTVAITDKRIGFDDGYGYPNCKEWDSAALIETEGNSKDKLVTLFKEKLGITTVGDSFDTDDSISWSFTEANFSPTADKGGSIKLTVDVNGTDDDAKPNCGGNGTEGYAYSGALGGTEEACKNRTNGYDRFQMIIYGNGKIDIAANDIWAINAVKINRNITSDNNSNEEDNKNAAATTK